MRNLDNYDVIFCDIDDTLVHGFWTDLMSLTWKTFHSPLLAEVLMDLQGMFHIFSVNKKLQYMLKNTDKPIIFLTARKECLGTKLLVKNILSKNEDVCICSLATDNPAADKLNKIVFFMQTCMYDKICLFDDNPEVREQAKSLDIDVFDPTALFEKRIG